MAVTVTNDFGSGLNAADSSTGWTLRGVLTMAAVDTASNVEGTGCLEARVGSGGGVGDATNNHGSTDFTDKHLYCWIRPSNPFDTLANSGVTLRISTDTTGVGNYGQWDVGGSDLGVRALRGYFNATCDLLRPFDTTAGTPPAITAVVSSGPGANFASGNGMAVPVFDAIKFGSLITVGGGTGGDPGTMQEVVDADITAGDGLFKNAGGAFFANVRTQFGNTGTASSEFQDANQVLIYESDLFITASLLGMEFVANSTGTNNFRLGTSSGSGVDKEGVGGGTIKAAGARPFRVIAVDADMDAVEFFGVSLTGPSALFDDPLRNFKMEDNGTSFTDDTRDANNSAGNDAAALPVTQAINDASYFGHDERFYEINISMGSAKTGTWTGTWEYSQGSSSWASLTDVADGTSNYVITGPKVVTFAIPDDWATDTVDTDSRYWIRFRISSFTSSGSQPIISQLSLAMAGDVCWEQSANEMIGCTLTNMGSVRVRGGAFVKKTTITDSIVPAKHGALDLGSADPAADTVRDLTIQNCNAGILLKGSGNTTYNFRNIQFDNNTNDVRVDFDGGDTVTINLLEGSDVPTIDNVNDSTVDIINAVTVRIEGLTEGAAAKVIADETILPDVDTTLWYPFARNKTLVAGASLGPTLVIARALKASFFDVNGILQFAATGVERFDHDPISKESLGLLIENSAENLAERSQTMQLSPWVSDRSTANVDQTTSPDGTVNAEELVEDMTASNTHRLRQSKTKAASSITYTLSVYAKANTRTEINLRVSDSSNLFEARYNLLTGLVSEGQDSGAFTYISSFMEDVGNGWFRCVLTGTTDSATTYRIQLHLHDGTGIGYTGDGVSGLFFWGCQLETNTFPTSYIETDASSVTRPADVVTSTDISWFTTTAGTFFARGSFQAADAVARNIMVLDDGGTTDQFVMELDADENINFTTTHNADTDGASNGAGVISVNREFRVSAAFADDDVIAYVDGTSSGADATAAIPLGDTMTTLRIGADSAGNNFDGHIAEIAYFNVRKTNTFLDNMSTGTGETTKGDVIFEQLANSSGVAEVTNFDYETAFNPNGLEVIARTRQQGLPNAAIQDDNGAFLDQTTNANSASANDMNLLPGTPVVNEDRYLFGHAEQFGQIKLDIGTAGTGGFTITWEYFDGSSFVALSGVTDGTSSLSVLGENTVSWTIPGDWLATTINSQGPFFYVRAAYTAGTVTITPLGTKVKLDVDKYLAFVQNRIVTSSGLTVFATWVRDVIAIF